MKTKDFCRDCGIPLTKNRNGLCIQCEKDRLKEKEKQDKKRNKYDRNSTI